MKEEILIVEDQFVEADYLRLMLTRAGYRVIDIARSVNQALLFIQQQRPDFVLLDIFLKGKQTGIDLAWQLQEQGIPFIYLSANSSEDVLNEAKATQPYGFLVKPFRERDLLVTLEIAKYHHQHSLEAKYRKEAQLKTTLNNIVIEPLESEHKFLKIITAIQPHIPFDFAALGFEHTLQPDVSSISFLRVGFNQYQPIGFTELSTITRKTGEELLHLQSNNVSATNVVFYNDEVFDNICGQTSLDKLLANSFHLRSYLCIPINTPGGRSFSFRLYSRRPDAYNAEHTALSEVVRLQLTTCFENILQGGRAHNAVHHAPPALSGHAAVGRPVAFEGIIGKSHLLLNALDMVGEVALMDTSVLILGESGTGKEKIADCIHASSNRKSGPFIKLNCATLPSSLIESELFGHEKGAFTGALEKRIGKFEKANKGTIFLDEIGEMPVELQVKLLRVLQEREIERVGGNDVIKIDVRVIAATNKNLEKEVAEGRFRLDLYYRLNVFPIHIPALRERKEDIPALAYHFMNRYNHKAGKRISGFSDDALKKMMMYDWPGNIRELENLVERQVLLEKGPIIEDVSLPIHRGIPEAPAIDEKRMKTIHENERDYIVAVLKKCNGRIWGSGGAAEILNLPPTTLTSKMKKLGIKKGYISSESEK
ncbi:sigma 54-interacting transcriptional regulator [Chitinophaga eiseniae]|uniref:Sigma 54-interacting transcriptional regulator n=2 Tax=Chitinophaga eiseniae TaxID=634771 RepID=A0A847SI56_9BACT|nr:sigma 54-interacting transcriptional regulator [Chitinophaga eiseniae]